MKESKELKELKAALGAYAVARDAARDATDKTAVYAAANAVFAASRSLAGSYIAEARAALADAHK